MSRSGPLSFDTYVGLVGPLVADTAAMLERVESEASVPDCPEWSAADLRDHCGGVLAFWIQQLRLADAGASGPNFDDGVRERYRLPLGELGEELLAELAAATPEQPCWNWSGSDLTAAWAARRMTQEFAVHRSDAAATAGLSRSIDTDLAADGINELLDVFVGQRKSDDEAQAEAEAGHVGVLSLSSSDRGRWLLAVGSTGAAATDETASPTATVQGPVDQILLRLWGRPGISVTESGDPAVMATWRALARFD